MGPLPSLILFLYIFCNAIFKDFRLSFAMTVVFVFTSSYQPMNGDGSLSNKKQEIFGYNISDKIIFFLFFEFILFFFSILFLIKISEFKKLKKTNKFSSRCFIFLKFQNIIFLLGNYFLVLDTTRCFQHYLIGIKRINIENKIRYKKNKYRK